MSITDEHKKHYFKRFTVSRPFWKIFIFNFMQFQITNKSETDLWHCLIPPLMLHKMAQAAVKYEFSLTLINTRNHERVVTNIYISLTQLIHISHPDAAAITFCSIIVVQVQSSAFAQHHHSTTFPWKSMVCTPQLNFNHFLKRMNSFWLLLFLPFLIWFDLHEKNI